MRAGGILPAIVGTFWLMLGTAYFLDTALGIAAGIYLSEYAPDNRWTRLIRIAIISLAGVPSVVYGLFGLGLFVLFFRFWDQHHVRFTDPIHYDPADHHQYY